MTGDELPKDTFFAEMARLQVALTFDDVRLRTGHSEVMPHEVTLETRFSRNIPLKIPIVSAAMDTVTEHEMAIELAKLGGIGVIHRNFTSEQQASEVSKVKHYLSALIEQPVCVTPDDTIRAVLEMREKRQLSFHTFPVVNAEGLLVGIITHNDFDFCDDANRLVHEVMSKELLTAEKGITVHTAYDKMTEVKKKVLPLVDSSGHLAGMYVFSDVKRIISGSEAVYNIDEKGRLRVAAAVGTGDEALQRLECLVKKEVDVIVIDTAHGDSKLVLETLKEVKKRFSLDVVVGNISEPESAERLLEAGADGIKIGQGPGSICTTRPIAGVGCPQVTAVYHCSKIARLSGVPVCADGGLKYSGDIPIAIGAGADSVMMGNMLAGSKESPGKLEIFEGRQWKTYRGMGSLSALEERQGSRERYRQRGSSQFVPEGVEGIVPYCGELKDIIFQYLGGLRSGMGYVGAATIQELKEKANFWRITNAGQRESHPHSIHITREPPNYSGGER